jgi:hypothetical protein
LPVPPRILRSMHELEGLDPALLNVWAAAFRYRTAFIWLALACVAVLAGKVLRFGRSGCPGRGGWFAALLLILSGFALLAAGTTAMWPWVRGQTLTGWWLVAHCAAGPAFVVLLAGAMLFYSPRPAPGFAAWLARAAFVAFVLAGLLTVVSILASMMKFVPADEQPWLYAVHRYASVGLVAAGFVWLIFGLLADRRTAGPART